MDIGIKIRSYRSIRGLSIRKLAEMANISHSFLADVEKGKKSPSISSLNDICTALGVPLTGLFTDEEEDLCKFNWFYNLSKEQQIYLSSPDNKASLEIGRLIYQEKLPASVTETIMLALFMYKKTGSEQSDSVRDLLPKIEGMVHAYLLMLLSENNHNHVTEGNSSYE